MKLTLGKANAHHATLLIDGASERSVLINSEHATAIAMQIARAFNRDKHFEAMIAALTPFKSSEMGKLLIGMIDVREDGAEQAQRNLSRLVSMIDVILDAVEADDGDE
jgi:hypothetical protein